MKRYLAIIISLLLLLAGAAFAESTQYQYVQEEEGVYITGYSGAETILRLPENIDGMPVTGIAAGAFRNNSSVVELYIPDSCKVIDEEAFAGCSALRDVYLGSGIEAINARAFADCPDMLSVSAVRFGFYEDPTAYEGSLSQKIYNGTDVEYFWNTSSGEDYDLMYIAACELMSRGEFETARDIFLSLYGYELSADNYFYCSARLFESRGETEAACAIYALMPDMNDSLARLEYYGGRQEVVSFLSGPGYDTYFSAYFGPGGRYEARLADKASAEESSGSAGEIIGGADEPAGIIVGGGIGESDPADEPEPTVGPAAEPAVTMEPNPALMAYHIFIDDMPYSFEDLSNSEGYYAMYYHYDDLATVDAYIALFEQQGWHTFSDEINGWKHIYVSAPNQQSYFYVSYAEADRMLAIMYEAGMDYGFDPKEGL